MGRSIYKPLWSEVTSFPNAVIPLRLIAFRDIEGAIIAEEIGFSAIIAVPPGLISY